LSRTHADRGGRRPRDPGGDGQITSPPRDTGDALGARSRRPIPASVRRAADMTSRDDFDRLLTAWFDADAPRIAPEHLLDQVLAQTARTPRRRTWRLLEGLSSMQATMHLPAPARGLILLPMLLLLAIVAIALIAV